MNTTRLHRHAGCVQPHSPRLRHADPFTWAKHLTECFAWRKRRVRGPGGALRRRDERPPGRAARTPKALEIFGAAR